MIDLRGTVYNSLSIDLPDHPTESHIAFVMKNREQREKDRTEEIDLLKDLESVGVYADTISDFVNTGKSYAPAIPVLYRYFVTGVYGQRLSGSFMRALTVKEAKGIGIEPFVREFIYGSEKVLPKFEWTKGYKERVQVGIQNDATYLAVAAQAMKYVAVKGESELIKTCFPYLEKSDIHPNSKQRIRKDLEIAFKRAGGKLPIR